MSNSELMHEIFGAECGHASVVHECTGLNYLVTSFGLYFHQYYGQDTFSITCTSNSTDSMFCQYKGTCDVNGDFSVDIVTLFRYDWKFLHYMNTWVLCRTLALHSLSAVLTQVTLSEAAKAKTF